MSEQIQTGAAISTHLDADQLNAFIEKALPEPEYVLALAHLAECADCREVVFLAQEAASELEPQIVRANPVPERGSFWRRWFAPLPLAGAAAFAAMLLMFVVWRHRPAAFVNLQEAENRQAGPSRMESRASAGAPPPAAMRMQAAPPPQPKAASAPSGISEASVRPPMLDAPPPAAAAKAMPRQPEGNAEQTPVAAARNAQTFAGMASGAAAAAPSDQIEARERMYNAAPAPPRVQQQAAPAPPPPSPQIATQPVAQAPMMMNKNAAALSADAAPAPAMAARSAMGKPAAELSYVSGKVVDPSGAMVPGASVTLHFAGGAGANQADVKTKTGQDGKFALAAVPPGKYDLKVSSPGFEASSQQVELQPHASMQVTPVLAVGAATQTVEVSDAAVAVEPKAAHITGKLVTPLPLPSGLDGVATAAAGGITLTLDSSGNLFEKHGGHKWKQITATWAGKAVQVRTIPGQSGGFQLSTDTRATWVSADGERWRQVKISAVP